MQNFIFLFLLLLPMIAVGQRKAPAFERPAALSWIPRPVLFGGPSLLGNGYQSVAANVGTALLLKSRRMIGDFEGFYMNARKTNDATIDNRKGHERFLQGRMFFPGTEACTSVVVPSGVKLQPRTIQKKHGGPRLARDKITLSTISVAAGR
jgi:hypothetical protein